MMMPRLIHSWLVVLDQKPNGLAANQDWDVLRRLVDNFDPIKDLVITVGNEVDDTPC